jgi:hypothetical protein
MTRTYWQGYATVERIVGAGCRGCPLRTPWGLCAKLDVRVRLDEGRPEECPLPIVIDVDRYAGPATKNAR